MPPNSEPTQNDVAAVNAFLTGDTPAPAPAATPAPQPQAPAEPVAPPTPQPQQPTEPAQPAQPQEPTDPFEQFAPQPTEPVAPQAPAAPTEPVAPATPAPQPAAPAEPQYQSFDDYLNSITEGLPDPTPAPKLEEIDQNDPAAIQKYFTDFATSIREETIREVQRTARLEAAEKKGWDEAFDKYPSIKKNPAVRDMVHNMRMGKFQQGIAMTPLQAAEEILKVTNANYRKGIADTQVVTTITDTQPVGGDSVEVIPQTPQGQASLVNAAGQGEAALANALDAMIKDGKL